MNRSAAQSSLDQGTGKTAAPSMRRKLALFQRAKVDGACSFLSAYGGAERRLNISAMLYG